jgi:hypothetical protein
MVMWVSPLGAQLPRLDDGFEDQAQWQVGASDGVRVTLRAVEGRAGRALCLDFDVAGVAGYASVRRALSIDFPPNYEFSFDVRGEAPVNNLEFKLIDASGENGWWVNYRDFVFPREWQRVKIKKRQIVFAWDQRSIVLKHAVRRSSYRQSWSGASRGSMCFDQLSMRALPPPTRYPTPILQASSARRGRRRRHSTERSRPPGGVIQPPTYANAGSIFSNPGEFGGWCCSGSNAFASRYDVGFPMTAATGEPCMRSSMASGRDPLYLPGVGERFLRLVLHDGPAHAYASPRSTSKISPLAPHPTPF